MNSGELRHRISIKQVSQTQDEFGQPTEALVDICTVWAGINPIVGKEFFAAETVNSEITHKVRMRYHTGITPDMRVIYGTKKYHIQSVINYQERNVELQLMCRELA